MVAVKMDGMIGHGEIAHTHAHSITEPYGKRIDTGKHAAVPRPHIEVGHLVDFRKIAARINPICAHDENEVTIDRTESSITRVHDEHSHHAHRHLHHLVGMWVVHEGTTFRELEFIDKGFAGGDMRLGKPSDPVHAVGQYHAMPVHGGVFRQFVCDKDADLVAFDDFNCRAGRLPIVAPEV